MTPGDRYGRPAENLYIQSEDLTNATWWSKLNGLTVTQNAVGPFGGLAFQIQTAASSFGGLNQAVSVVDGVYTLSLWVQIVTAGSFQFGIGASFGGAATATADWRRYSFTAAASGGAVNFQIITTQGAGAIDVNVWGPQLERRTRAGLYVPTTTRQRQAVFA